MRNWLGVVAVCACMCAASTGPAAAAKPPLGFGQSEPLNTSCAALAEGGVRVGVRNETAVIRKVRVGLSLTGEAGNRVRAKAVCGGLTRSPRKFKLLPGGGAVVTLRAISATAKGSFSGSLSIFARKGRVARRDLTIAPVPAATALAVTPLVGSLSAAIEDTNHGPFWIPVEGSNADLPTAPKDDAGSEALAVGALTGPGGPIAVTYGGESKALTPGIAQVGLELEGDLSPGTYSGQVDLAPSDDAKGVVTLELKVSSEWWKAVAALLVGILAGLLLLRISGRTLPRARLLGRVEGLTRRYDDARKDLEAAGGGFGTWNATKLMDLNELQNALDIKIEAATARWRVLVQIEKTVVDNLEAAIAALETQIDLLQEVPQKARGLEAALLSPRALQLQSPSDSGGGLGKPQLETEADELLTGPKIKLRELKPRLDAMDAKAKQIRTFLAQKGRLEGYWQRVRWLEDAKHPAADPDALSTAKKRLEDCRHDLWAASDDEALKRVADQLDETAEEMVQLKVGAPAVKLDFVEALTEALQGQPANPMAPSSFQMAPPVAPQQPTPPSSPASLAVAPPAPESPRLTEREASRAVRRALIIQFFVVLAAAALAVVSGLELLYAGKTWGTWWDIVVAIAWGTAAQAVATTLVTSLDNLGALASLWRRP